MKDGKDFDKLRRGGPMLLAILLALGMAGCAGQRGPAAGPGMALEPDRVVPVVRGVTPARLKPVPNPAVQRDTAKADPRKK